MSLEEEIAALRKEVREIQDRRAIWDCLVRESRGRDRHDAELTSSCYWEDGGDEHGQVVTMGPQYGEAANAGHRAGFAANSHNLVNHSCELDGDTANCETYVIGGLLSLDGKTCKVAFGRYLDRLEKRDGVWKIKVRRCPVDMVAEGDASWLQTPALAGFIKGQRSKADVSYARPIAFGPEGERWS